MALSKNNGEVQSVVFHRNYIETTALSLAAHSNTSWVTVQMLLDPFSGYEIKSARIEDAVPNNVRAVGASAPPQSTTTVSDFRSSSPPTTRTERNSKEGPEPRLFSFADLSDILVAVGMGLLIGWRRGRGEVVINPDVKAEQVRPQTFHDLPCAHPSWAPSLRPPDPLPPPAVATTVAAPLLLAPLTPAPFAHRLSCYVTAAMAA